jgi:predicted DNA-binding protein (UPF0251 family)
VRFQPNFTLFKPQGVPARQLASVTLTFDELEALRLKDLEGLAQDEIANQMGVSQSTVQRILAGARQKVTDAIVRGKMLQIEGGAFTVARNGTRQFQCGVCRHVWEAPFGTGQSGRDMQCPSCQSDSIHRTDNLSAEDAPADADVNDTEQVS